MGEAVRPLKQTMRQAIRLSAWRGNVMRTAPLVVSEDEFLILMRDAIAARVFPGAFLLKANGILNEAALSAREKTMAWTIDTALEDDLIDVVNRDDDLGIYEFTVGKLATIVSLEIGLLPSGRGARYHRSHDIKTPEQTHPYVQSRFYWDDVPYALHQAVSSLTEYYKDGVKAGHPPEESWLVKN